MKIYIKITESKFSIFCFEDNALYIDSMDNLSISMLLKLSAELVISSFSTILYGECNK